MDATGTNHQRRRELLAGKVAGPGVTDPQLRADVMARSAGATISVENPYDALARQIGESSYRVTDAQVEAVKVAAGSDKAAFEMVFAASVGAGLARWDAALSAIEGLDDAPA
ncbi:hypothetical protein CVV67_00770 [Arthrobacter stackebrandtii]|nr:hypothetical protein CVV67_00770 [Arthrobacter stackebrandtii]